MKAAPELASAGVVLVAGVVGLVVEGLVGGRGVDVGSSHFPMQTVCLICFPSPPLIWQV